MKITDPKRRLKLLSRASLITYLLLVLSYIGNSVQDFKMGFEDGYNSSKNSHSISTYFIKVNPKGKLFNFPFSIKNETTQELVSFRPSQMTVHLNSEIKKPRIIKTQEAIQMILALALTFIFFYIPFVIHKLIKTLQNGDFFRQENETNFRRTGRIFGITFFITFVTDYIDYNIVESLFSFSDLRIMKESPSFIWLVCGLLFVIFAEILRNGIALREENELTV